MPLKEHAIITTACLVFFNCFGTNNLGVFDQLASTNVILTSANKLAASTEGNNKSVVFKEETKNSSLVYAFHSSKKI